MKTSGKYPALDGLRGVAILGVLIAHTVVAPLAAVGTFGVDLFFVLSGFLITGILIENRNSPNYFQAFYMRRALRLFPAYFAYLAAVMVAVPVIHRAIGTKFPDYGGPWWWYWTYLSNWKAGHGAEDSLLGHFWSLAVEEQFYLVWAVVVWLTPPRRLFLVCAVMIPVAFLLRAGVYWTGEDWNAAYRLTPMRMDALGLGTLCALVLRRKDGTAEKVARAMPLLALLTIAAALVFQSASWESWGVGTIVASLAACTFAGWLLGQVLGPSRWLMWGPLQWVGQHSYGIYVFHGLAISHVGWAVAWLGLQSWISMPLGIGTSFLIAWTSMLLIEKPALRAKDLFRYQGSGAAILPPAR